jgi:hypothetical protein
MVKKTHTVGGKVEKRTADKLEKISRTVGKPKVWVIEALIKSVHLQTVDYADDQIFW